MADRLRYRRKPGAHVTAVRLDLDVVEFTFMKWGGVQRAERGDWLVDNGQEVYTVDGDTFARTYEKVSPGVYEKTADVWAEEADSAGTVKTREGTTDYVEGDYVVYEEPDGTPAYAISAAEFHDLYEPA
jgi:hypothetical protein